MEVDLSLTQKEYEQVKQINKQAFEILLEFINIIEEILQDMGRYLGNSPDLAKIDVILKQMYGMSRGNFEKVQIIVEWTKNKQEQVEEGNKSIIRYYYNDVYSAIKNPVYQQKIILKKYSKKILMKIRNQEYRKRVLSSRVKIKKRLDKLDLNK